MDYNVASLTIQSHVTQANASTQAVLLVEDERAVRDLLTAILRREGFAVRAAATAEEALALYRQHACDLLVTDVVLPEMSGPELADTICSVAPDVRVLFMSGYTGSFVPDADSLGASRGFIQKPFTPQALIESVQRLLKPARTR